MAKRSIQRRRSDASAAAIGSFRSRGVAVHVQARMPRQQATPKLDVLHRIEIAENVKANNKALRMVYVEKRNFALQSPFKIGTGLDSIRPSHLVAEAGLRQ